MSSQYHTAKKISVGLLDVCTLPPPSSQLLLPSSYLITSRAFLQIQFEVMVHSINAYTVTAHASLVLTLSFIVH
eukprot:m.51578 g.51578  ORF g.51578 m.51578 type:complete len:74 (-) comp11246_c0_seq1:1128-1349(-)